MEKFFCADESCQAQEPLIGWAVTYPTYVLVECPPPWAANAFESKQVPESWRSLIQETKRSPQPIRPLLIYNPHLYSAKSLRVLIFQQQSGFSVGYDKFEFQVADLEAAAVLVKDYLAGKALTVKSSDRSTRDILICTHGSQDQCCARYGQPFFRQAIATVDQLGLDSVRIWQSSHFGGHRFAPTMIDFPEGRYYGRLTPETFASILTRTGQLQHLKQVYRGWGLLPAAAQVLEQELWLQYGWDWLSFKVAGRVLHHNEDESFNQVEVLFETPTGDKGGYQAEIRVDCDRRFFLKGSCNSPESVEMYPYVLTQLSLIL
jgi:hypothetical protein